MFLHKHLA